jgi:WD40 repeat protein
VIRQELKRLHEMAGAPTIDRLKEHADLRGHSVGRSTLATVLSSTGRLRWATVAAFVDACVGYAERRSRPLPSDAVEMLTWRTRFDETYPGDRPRPPARPLSMGTQASRYLWLAPPPLPGYVERPGLAEELVEALAASGAGPVVVTAVHGTGGFGKTTLVRQVCHRDEVKALFPGGALWVELGETLAGPDLALRLNDVVEQLTGSRPSLSDPQQVGLRLGEALDARQEPVLLVLDDVWRDEQVLPFLLGGQACRRLVTTRRQLRSLANASPVHVDAMTEDQARSLLLRGVSDLPNPVIDELVRLTGRWPLLIDLANRSLVRRGARGDQAAAGTAISRRLRTAGPTGLDSVGLERANDRDRIVGASVAASMDLLTAETRERYLELGIFAEDTEIPSSVLELLWGATGGLDSFEAEQLCETLQDIGLVAQFARDSPAVRLHDVLRSYLRGTAGPARLERFNATLVDAAAGLLRPPTGGAEGRAWWCLPTDMDYLWRHIVEHLASAGRTDEVDRLVTDLRWIAGRISRYGPAAAESDLARSHHPVSAALTDAIRRSAHLLAPTEPEDVLIDILISRLDGVEELRPLVAAFRSTTDRRRLVNRFLPPDRPHPAFRRAIHAGQLAGHRSIASVMGSTWLVTTMNDGSVRIWDTATGDLISSIDAGYQIYETVVAADGTWLATTGASPLVEIRNPATGELTWALDAGRSFNRHLLAVGPDTSWAATVSTDNVLLMRDGRTQELRWVVQTEHDHGVAQILADPAGTWLATLGHSLEEGGEQDLRMWDSATGTLRHRLDTGHAWGMVVPPDGTWLAVTDSLSPLSTGFGHTVLILDTATGRVRHVIDTGHRNSLAGLAVAPNGTWLATADFNWYEDDPGSSLLQTWDVVTGRRRWAIETGHPYGITQMAVDPDGAWLATIGQTHLWFGGDPILRLWDADTGASRCQIETGHRHGIDEVVASPDGTWLATTDDTGGQHHFGQRIRIWDTVAHPPHRAVGSGHPHGAGRVAAAPDGTWLATIDYTRPGGDSRDPLVRIWDAATGSLRLAIDTGNPHGVRHVVAAPDSAWLATIGSGERNPVTSDPVVRIWDAATGGLRLAIDTGNPHGVRHVAVAPDGSWLATTGRRDVGRPGTPDWSKSWGFDFATGFYEPFSVPGDPLVRIWDVATGLQRLVIDTGDPRGVRRISLAPDGTWLATTGRSDLMWPAGREDPFDPVVRIWDAATGALRHAIDTGHITGVDYVAMDPDGAWFATTGMGRGRASRGGDPVLRIWDATTGALRHVIGTDHPEGINGVVAGPGGAWLATNGVGDDPIVRIWDPATGEQRYTLRTDDSRGVKHLRIADDGSWLVTAGRYSLQLWKPDGRCLAAMRVDGDITDSVALSGGTGVALAGSNGLYVFDLL